MTHDPQALGDLIAVTITVLAISSALTSLVAAFMTWRLRLLAEALADSLGRLEALRRAATPAAHAPDASACAPSGSEAR